MNPMERNKMIMVAGIILLLVGAILAGVALGLAPGTEMVSNSMTQIGSGKWSSGAFNFTTASGLIVYSTFGYNYSLIPEADVGAANKSNAVRYAIVPTNSTSQFSSANSSSVTATEIYVYEYLTQPGQYQVLYFGPSAPSYFFTIFSQNIASSERLILLLPAGAVLFIIGVVVALIGYYLARKSQKPAMPPQQTVKT